MSPPAVESTSPPTPTPTISQSNEVFFFSPYTQSFLTDGTTTIVPNMRYSDIPDSLRATLVLPDDTQKVPEGEPDRDTIILRVYGNDDLEIMTISYDAALVDTSDPKYSEAGTEYIRTITAKSSVFYNYRYVRLGDPSSSWSFLQEDSRYASVGTPFIEVITEHGVVTQMSARSVTDMEALKDSYIPDGDLVCS